MTSHTSPRDLAENSTRRRLLVWTLIVTLTAVLATGCTGDENADRQNSHSGRDVHSTAPGPQPTDQDPGQVATAWLQIVYAWEPVTDTSPTDALIRARALATGTLAAEQPPTATVRNTLPQWSAWRSSGDIITATVADPDVTTVDDTNAVVRATVTQTVLHSDGDTTPWEKLEVTVTLQKTLAGLWKVSDSRQVPAQQGGN